MIGLSLYESAPKESGRAGPMRSISHPLCALLALAGLAVAGCPRDKAAGLAAADSAATAPLTDQTQAEPSPANPTPTNPNPPAPALTPPAPDIAAPLTDEQKALNAGLLFNLGLQERPDTNTSVEAPRIAITNHGVQIVGDAAVFDGAEEDHLLLAAAPTAGLSEYTIAMRIELAAMPEIPQPFYAEFTDRSRPPRLILSVQGASDLPRLACELRGSTKVHSLIYPLTAEQAGGPFTLALVVNPESIALYVDGALADEVANAPDDTPESDGVTVIGAAAPGGRVDPAYRSFFNGKIYAVRAYNRALSPAEVARLEPLLK